MPDDRGWTESNDPASLLNSPAKINIIPCFAVFGIKAAHAFKRPAIERHVTTGNMLGNHICEQHMARSARCRCNAGLNPIFGWRRNIRSAYSSVITAYKSADEIIEPIRIDHAVRIGIGEHVPLGSAGAGIAGVAQSLIVLMNVAHPWELRSDVRCIVGRSVIDQNNLILGVIQFT